MAKRLRVGTKTVSVAVAGPAWVTVTTPDGQVYELGQMVVDIRRKNRYHRWRVVPGSNARKCSRCKVVTEKPRSNGWCLAEKHLVIKGEKL